MDLLKALYNINSKSGCEGRIKAFVLQQLADVPLVIEEDEIGNLFLTKGVAQKYPCVTAHLDEVYEKSPFKIVEEGKESFLLFKNRNPMSDKIAIIEGYTHINIFTSFQ